MTKSGKVFVGGLIGLVIAGVTIFFTVSRETQELKSLAEKFPDWTQVSGKLATFDARFPKGPKYTSEDLPVPNSDFVLKQETYILQEGSIRYTVSAVIYPNDIPGDEADNLHDALLGMVASVPGAVLVKEDRRSTLAGKPYIEFSIKNADISYKGMMLMQSRTLFELIMESPEKSFDPDTYRYFVAAFNAR